MARDHYVGIPNLTDVKNLTDLEVISLQRSGPRKSLSAASSNVRDPLLQTVLTSGSQSLRKLSRPATPSAIATKFK